MKKSILIIGGGFGLSWSIARLFSKEGMDVSIASRNTEKYANLDSEIKLNLYNCDASIIEDVNNFNDINWFNVHYCINACCSFNEKSQ